LKQRNQGMPLPVTYVTSIALAAVAAAFLLPGLQCKPISKCMPGDRSSTVVRQLQSQNYLILEKR